MLASSNNRGPTTVREAWPRCPNCRRPEPGVAEAILGCLLGPLADWILGLINQRVVTCGEKEAAESWQVSPYTQKPLDQP